MNSAIKHTIIAMATVALSLTAACKSDSSSDPVELEATAGAEAESAEVAAVEDEPVQARRDAKKAAKDSEKAAAEVSGAK